MRLPDAIRFPMAMTLGALSNEDLPLIEQMGYEIGMQTRLLGVHMNLGPVVDVNNNAQNPVIYMRSFGDKPDIVSRNAIAYMQGMQRAGIYTCAKHFPGHGNTANDSHYTLPILTFNRSQLQNTELIPFQKMITAKVDAIMTAHLSIPALEPNHNWPASLSHAVTCKLLQDELGFKGLVITDGLGMQGVTNHFSPGNLELQALHAGNDILLCPIDVPTAIATIKKAVEQEKFPLQELNKRVLKVITAKQNILQKWKDNPLPQNTTLNSESAKQLKKQLYSHAVTLVHNRSGLLPLQLQEAEILTIISIGDTGEYMLKTLKKEYPQAQINTAVYTNDLAETVLACQGSQVVVVALIGNNRGRVAPELAQKAQTLITTINAQKIPTVGILCASPYLAPYLNKSSCLIAAYENDPDAQEAAILALAGKLTPKGQLPVAIPGVNA